MKRELNNLYKLATKYVKFAKEIKISEGFTDFKVNEFYTAQIYMNDNFKVWQVKFNNIEVKLYSEKVDMPISMNVTELKRMNLMFSEFLNVTLKKQSDDFKNNALANAEQLKEKRIEELENELKELKHEVE